MPHKAQSRRWIDAGAAATFMPTAHATSRYALAGHNGESTVARENISAMDAETFSPCGKNITQRCMFSRGRLVVPAVAA
jgi:hypothetical protein